jgi:hypothetical protein
MSASGNPWKGLQIVYKGKLCIVTYKHVRCTALIKFKAFIEIFETVEIEKAF